MVKILYFGRLSDVAGRREEIFDLPANIGNLIELKSWLDETHQLEGSLDDPSIKTMINQTLVHDNFTLKGDEEIGFLPPVGGG